VIEPTQVVKGLGRMSRPTTSCSKSLNVRTKASPRCPELPVTKTLIFDSFSLDDLPLSATASQVN